MESHETSTTMGRPPRPEGSEKAMSIADRVRKRRLINRQTRAIDRAWMTAPTQSMRDEIAIFAQRKTF